MSVGDLGLLIFAGCCIHRRAFATPRAVVAVTQVQASGVLGEGKIIVVCSMFVCLSITTDRLNSKKMLID
jgi:hypothetical protein